MEDSLFEEEWNKMLSGEFYNAAHPEFLHRLEVTREKVWEFNRLNPSKTGELRSIFRSIVEDCGEKFHVNQPFRCDYGCNIHIGNNFFANFNLTILDEAPVTMGDGMNKNQMRIYSQADFCSCVSIGRSPRLINASAFMRRHCA